MAHSLKSLLVLSVAACIGLSACNKLGYGKPRTAPEGQAILGPKRMPQLNGAELQKQRSMRVPQQQAMQQRPQVMPIMVQHPPQSMVPMQPQMQAPAPAAQQIAPQQIAPQVPANYPVTPYSASPQSYQPSLQQAPAGQSYMQQPQQQPAAIQQSAYGAPYDYAPGSYNAPDLARTVSVTDYYTQDSAQYSPVATNQEWYAPAAPVKEVYGRQLPVSAPGTYSAGYGMDAAYGRYQVEPLPVMPQEPSYYQPMTARHADTYPARDPYAQEVIEPQYNNFYYGGEGMPQPQQPLQQQPQTQQIQQVPTLNPVSQERYLEEVIRRPLEEPPMLATESALPNPNRHSTPYYGGY